MLTLCYVSFSGGNEIESITTHDPLHLFTLEHHDAYKIFPATIFVTTKDSIHRAIGEIEIDLGNMLII